MKWESIARHRTVVVLPAKHRLPRQRRVRLAEFETLFFVGMSETTHPGFRDWLNETCRQAGFTPRVAFRTLSPPLQSDHCIAWNRDNDSRALQEYIQIIKGLSPTTR